jgi:peptidyl-tRNA hydrolase
MTAKCPTLYILMRTDMASMNPGKGMAQAAHASDVFMFRAFTADFVEGFDEWTGVVNLGEYPEEDEDSLVQSKGAGTTITLAVGSEKELREIVEAAREDGFRAGMYLDPSYPIRDGLVTHLLPVITCGYVFTACRNTMRPSCLAGLSLHP